MANSPRSLSWSNTFSISKMIDGWIPSVGSSNIRTLGSPTSARAMANCCCCPPLKLPPIRSCMSANTGKRVNTSSGTSPPAARACKPISKFSRTVSCGKISRPCGTYPNPRRVRLSAVSAVTSSPAKNTRPLLGANSPMIALSSVVLPTPLRPITATIEPPGTCKLISRKMRLPP